MEKTYEIVELTVEQHPYGLDLAWAAKGLGFGHLRFGIKDNKWWADTECMSEGFAFGSKRYIE